MAEKTRSKTATKADKSTSAPPKAASKGNISANDHAMGILTKAASTAIKAAGKAPSLPVVVSCVKTQTGTAQTPISTDYLRSFTTARGVLDSIGDCINGAFSLKPPYRWASGKISADWTVGVLAATTDVFRAHQPTP